MARSWYLLTTPYGQLSGFEGEALADFAQEGFSEMLASGVAYDVELCNYDLSIRKPIKAIIQNNTADTKLNALNRHMIVPIGTCKAGMYVKYKNRYWLIVGLVDDNMMYEKAVMVICNYLLSWISASGDIVQRWVSVSSASQYNNGETTTYQYQVRTDQLMVLLPDDEESLMLNSGHRLVIDKRCSIYEKSISEDITVDTSKELTVYKITRTDTVLYNYNDSGHTEFMAYQDEQHENDGYYVVDGKGYWLCDIPQQKYNEIPILSCSIECDSDTIFAQLEPGVFTAKVYDKQGKEVEFTPVWTVDPAIVDRLHIEHVGKSILISTDDPDCVNKSFDLTLSAESYTPITKRITIRAFI